MPDVHLLFSYGTLQQPEVQEATFGRRLDGRPDAIVGFELDILTITDPHVIATSGSDRHPVLRPAPDGGEVAGTVFTIDEADLAAADEYEVDDYRRIFAELGWTDYSILPHMLYRDSRHDSVVPLAAPPDTVRYDPEAHGPKPVVEFDRPVWGKFDIFVRLDPTIDEAEWQRITRVEGWEAHWEF